MNKKYCAYKATAGCCYIKFHDHSRQKVVNHIIENTTAEQGYKVLPFTILKEKYSSFVFEEDIIYKPNEIYYCHLKKGS
jgi:hypothetical protein